MNGQVHYISGCLDNNFMTIDSYSPPPRLRGTDLNVAFQMDSDYRQDPYPVWLDEVSLSAMVGVTVPGTKPLSFLHVHGRWAASVVD